MQEIWKPILGCEALYEASNHGRIRSLDRYVAGADGSVRLSAGRVLAPQSTGRRYPAVSISIDGVRKSVSIHRMVALAFIPNPLNLRELNHKDGNKENSSVENLEWCDRATNNDHAISTGLKPPVQGQKHGRSVLTELEVLDIRSKFSDGHSMKSLSHLFGVTTQSIHGIVRRKYWTHI